MIDGMMLENAAMRSPPKSEPVTVGQFLEPLIIQRGLTVNALARTCALDRGYLRRVIRTGYPIGMEASMKLSEGLDIDFEEILVVQVKRQAFEYRRERAAALRSNAVRPPPQPRTRRRLLSVRNG